MRQVLEFDELTADFIAVRGDVRGRVFIGWARRRTCPETGSGRPKSARDFALLMLKRQRSLLGISPFIHTVVRSFVIFYNPTKI